MVVVMSLSRMASVDYLVGHVAAGDGRAPSAGSPMTRYYTAEGYPPGHLARHRSGRPRCR